MHDPATTITKAIPAQAGDIYALLMRCKEHLATANIFQWTDAYPTPATVMQDIDNDHLYCLTAGGRCAGVITINQVQDEEYATVPWACQTGKPLIVHRLAIDPEQQGNGYARQLMDFAEDYAQQHGYSSIRLDAYSVNKRSLNFYEQRGYEKRGEVFFPGRPEIFFCFESVIER